MEPYWQPARRNEVSCPHGIGHPLPGRDPIHGCDGCCSREDFPGRTNSKPSGEPYKELDLLSELMVENE